MSLARLHQALRDHDVESTMELAAGLEHVPLRFAARITGLLADTRDPRYDAAARRLLVRVLEEVDPGRGPLVEVKKLADVLAHMHHPYYQMAARLSLQDVIGQLHQREIRLRLEFEADP